MLKLGADGIVASDSVDIHHIPGHSVNSFDATGTGDCCAGALLASLAQGDEFLSAWRYADAAAALRTTGYGAVAPLPKRATVLAFLDQCHRGK